MKRSRALDGLRGIAIALVLIWHYIPRLSTTPELLLAATRIFWSGVDLFFVLSGFLIASILLENAGSKNYFSTFYIRRGARILPLYLLVFSVLAAFVYLEPDFLKKIYRNPLPLWSYLTFTQNFLYAARLDFFDPWIDVTWSLAVEEQFYVFLSLLIWKLNRKNLALTAIVLLALAPILRHFAPNYIVAFLLPLHRADSLMMGVLLALVWQWNTGKEFVFKYVKHFRALSVLLLISVILLSFRYITPGGVFGHFWLALFFGNIVLLTLVGENDPSGAGLRSNRFLEWLGLRSYGIYLFHKPVQILTPFVFAQFLDMRLPRWTEILVCIAAVFVAAELSYRILEKPIMDWGHRFKYKD